MHPDIAKALEAAKIAADDYYMACSCDECDGGCMGMVRAAVVAFVQAMPEHFATSKLAEVGLTFSDWTPSRIRTELEKET